jgi:hypothetical protein
MPHHPERSPARLAELEARYRRSTARLSELERHYRRKLRRAELLRVTGLLMFVVFIWIIGYAGRVGIVEFQRRGCERGKLDRIANAQGWRIAEDARRGDGQIAIADRYARIAAGLERRSRVDCRKAYPNPGPFGYRR